MVCLTICLSYCMIVCLSYCVIVCLFYAKSAAKILLFLQICKQNPKNMQILPISAFFCFIVLYCALFCFFPLCALFAHHCANLLSPLSGAGGGCSFSFLSHICGSFPRLVPFFSFPSPCSLFQFSPALFPFSSFFFYRQIVFAALLCPLRRDLIPTKHPLNPLSSPKISLF